ncbi:hypothetical protein EC5905_2622 [Escherichia coli 5905]|uniref:Uncharacterized protein n=1 Tax=Escherichia coli ISC7 TaxID=1432555 RepID=W1F4Z0_ECOLX|nr:hypothetical protein ECDEC7D_0444 [Escherichia coli DEC7D]EHW05161.1 hypothetical protein ECDEC7E_0272 [Escherichia coli DEC7E]EKH93624.1 hypothetical protein EC5905_2622 [Escherichia coli 5905]CDL28097.1 hypothetical protein [Escherichia coli ISC7]
MCYKAGQFIARKSKIAHRYTAQESDFSQHYNAGGSYYVC